MDRAEAANMYEASTRRSWQEDQPSQAADLTFVTISCENERCAQYNKFKILRLPKIHTPAVKVDLSD